MHPSKIIQWNCRGFKINFNEISLLIHKFNPVAFCLQETHLKQSDNVTLKHYSLYNCYDPNEDRAKGGSSICIRNNIMHSEIKLATNLQATAVRISLHKTITLCSIYIPPQYKLELQELNNLITQLPSPYIIMGDFNGHNPLWGSDKLTDKGKKLEDFANQNNLCILNDGSNTYLHPGNGSYTSIDISLTDPTLACDLSWTVHDDLCGSDHFPILIEDITPSNNNQNQNWKLSKADWNLFNKLCNETIKEDTLINIDDPISKFSNTLLEISEKCIPKTSTNPKKIKKPWFNDDCKEAIKSRKKAEKRFNLYPLNTNLDNYRKLKAKARRTFNTSRRNSWRNFVSKLNSHTTINKVWNAIKKIKGKNTNKRFNHLKVSNTLITDVTDISNTIANSISKTSSTEHMPAKFIDVKNREERKDINFTSDNLETYNKLFSIDELKRSLSKSHDTAVGPDEIHYQILKHLPQNSLKCLLSIFNHIWKSGNFPKSWKEAIIIPIPKPGKDHSDPSNYRPIALTSCICKTMERMINDRLVWFLESQNLLADIQCGFRSQRSTLDHLVKLESFIRDAFINKEHAVSIFFDLEKAYDTTWRYGILRDLHNMGLRGNLPIFVSNFLTERQFKVRLGSTYSNLYNQENGVPQGSILSVTLFSIKINSLAQVLKNDIEGCLFVDDFGISYRSKNMASIERQLQLCLNKIQNWADNNGFKFSKSKTMGIHFCQKRKHHNDPDLKLNGTPIKIVKEFKFLGVIFDSKLSFVPHNQMCQGT